MTQRSRQVKHARRLKALQWAIALAIGSSVCSSALAMRVGHSRVVSVPGAPLQFTYVQANPTASTPRRSFQIVRVPQYGNLTLGGQLNALPWDGSSGGVIALDVARTMNFAGHGFVIVQPSEEVPVGGVGGQGSGEQAGQGGVGGVLGGFLR